MSTHDSPTLTNRLFVATQYVIPQHFLSRLVYRLTRSRADTVKNALIKSFMRGFSPDMSDAMQRDPLAYASFNEFFTRALRPGARPIDPNDSVLVSPVDGALSQIGRLDGSQIVQAKGHSYSLGALLDYGSSQANWASRFTDGCFATLYLAPFNYHRIHMPLSGTLRAAWYVPGQLFSVNAVTAAAVPGLFARNEWVVRRRLIPRTVDRRLGETVRVDEPGLRPAEPAKEAVLLGSPRLGAEARTRESVVHLR